MSKHILILAGDGIGPEIVKAAEQVLTRVNDQFNLGLTWEQGLLGGAAIDAHGSPFYDVQLECQVHFLLKNNIAQSIQYRGKACKGY